MSHESGAFSEQIEETRTQLVSLAGLLVAGGFTVTLAIEFTLQPQNPDFMLLIAAGALLGLAGLLLGRLGRRPLATLLLAGGLATLITILVLNHQLQYEIALAAYVGVLLIAVVGSSQNQALAATVIIVAVAVLGYLSQPESGPTIQGSMAIAGLLIATGVTLSWLQENLLRAINQLEFSSARLQRLSHQDALTGLGNRRGFDESLVESLRLSSDDRPLALVVIDVDKLKGINDKHGHPTGDQALQAVADAIRASTRESDSAARIGGDEFGILLSTGGLAGARQVARRINQHLEKWSLNGVDLSVSIGAAETIDPDQELETLLEAADADMYAHRSQELPKVRSTG